ncbi:MAG: hypothetical protein AAFP13_01615 [Pseudomonadota bacterium]
MHAENAEQESAFVSQLSPLSKRMQFFGMLKTLSPEQLAHFTQLDFSRELALVALDMQGDRETQIGTARSCPLPGRTAAEFAVVVDDGWRGPSVSSGPRTPQTTRSSPSGVRSTDDVVRSFELGRANMEGSNPIGKR